MSDGRKLTLVLLVMSSIGLQLINAALIKHASLPAADGMVRVAVILMLVLVLAFGRLLLWNAIHRRYPVSLAYPMSALFFPAVLVLAWSMGESIDSMRVAGCIVVMLGVFLILSSDSTSTASPPNDG